MRRLIILAAYLVASLSASDAAPGARIRVYAGCDSGLIAVDAQQGIRVGSVDGEGLGQTVDLAIAADAWPGLRRVVVRCGDVQALLPLTVRGGYVVWVPMP